MRLIRATDLFCGAGGTSAGLYAAADDLGYQVDLLAVNHWSVAIRSHSYNHKLANHLCESLDNVNPRVVVPGGHLDLMVASPECTHHSNARGGVPCSDQSRASAWHVLRWAEALRIDSIVVENVPEFEDWGPLGVNGRPLKSRRGETFKGFIVALASLGYRVEHRVLNAADYGDATSRRRLFVLARRGRGRIEWPKVTHGDGHSQPYKTARDIIDWNEPSRSIFTRSRPLKPNTIRRIEAGLRKFGGEAFLAILRGTGGARSIERPLPAVTAKGQHLALCEPFLVNCKGTKPSDRGEMALVEPQPFLTKYYGTGGATSVDTPLDTVTTKHRFALVEPCEGKQGMDIHLRMLQPHELAAAHSLEQMTFFGTKGQVVEQIGNSVPRELARALCRTMLPRAGTGRTSVGGGAGLV